jgi:hypothetical protein
MRRAAAVSSICRYRGKSRPSVAKRDRACVGHGGDDADDWTQAEWLPLIGITYDPRDDAVEIALDGLDHMIRKSREIYLDDRAAGLTSLEIVDADGVRQIVKLKDQLMLPPAPQT